MVLSYVMTFYDQRPIHSKNLTYENQLGEGSTIKN